MAAISVIAADFGIIIVTAAVLAVLAQRTNQPKLVAYIIAGILLGPMVLDTVTGTELSSVLSDLGLAFLLFFIGAELRFDEVREILAPVVKIALPQMALTGLLGAFLGLAFGFDPVTAVIVGMAVMYGSTAVIVKLLTDNGDHTTLPGKIDIGVLLVQDITVIILMAIIAAGPASPGRLAANIVEVLFLVGVIAAVTVASSRYILPALSDLLFKDIQTFLIHGLAWFFLFVIAADWLGLSIEVGAFLAGLGLAQLPYRSEIRERVRPLTTLFVALFFITFGLNMEPGAFTAYWMEAVIAAAVLIVGKFLIMFVLIDWQRFTPHTSFTAAVTMTQTSEFSLVLGGVALSAGYITQEILGFLSIVALLTMGASAYLINYSELLYRRFEPLLQRIESEEKTDADIHTLDDHAIIIGYNDIVRRIVPVLTEYVDDIVLIDRNPHNTGEAKELDVEYIFGDAKHRGIRESAGIDRARIIISFSEEIEANTQVLEERPSDAIAFVRATTREEAGELYDFGADYIIRKNAIAADQFIDHLQQYFDDRDAFQTTADNTRDDLTE
ncbi:MAG: cation:proton antiporter, partial [Candidatus Nanohaloarchaea archaeon]